MIIAVDFDGTLCENRYPLIGSPNKQLISILINRQKAGDILILNTCRTGQMLQQAINFCKQYGLEFDYANENCKELVEQYGDCRKISANVYIDDKSILPESFVERNLQFVTEVKTEGRQKNSRSRNTSLRVQKAQKGV